MVGKKVKTRDIAYEEIKHMIVSNEIKPGELLFENALAKELGISRTPIREAIFTLEAEGFINTIPNKGSEVVKLNMRDIVEFMQIREGLEGIAARIAAEKGNKDLFREMLGELEKVDMEDETQKEHGLAVGRQLHALILTEAGNKKLLGIVNNLTAQIDRIMIMSRKGDKQIQTSHGEHIALSKAIIAGDEILAEKIMRNHIIGASNSALQVFHQDFR